MEYVGQFHFFFPLLQNNNITPTSGWVFALEIMFDGIGKDVSLSLTVLLSVLLTAKHNGTETIVLGSQQYTQKDGKGKANVFANAIKHDFKSKNPTTRWSDIIRLK